MIETDNTVKRVSYYFRVVIKIFNKTYCYIKYKKTKCMVTTTKKQINKILYKMINCKCKNKT